MVTRRRRRCRRCRHPGRDSDHIEVDLWSKLVMNCAYNAISAPCVAQHAAMVALPEVRAVMCEAVDEVAAVAIAGRS